MKGRTAHLVMVCAFASLAAGGCSSSGGNPYRDYVNLLRQGFGTPRITLAQAAAVPYASMSYRIDGGPERMIILASDSGGNLLWTSADHIVLTTRDGRLRRTVGLAHDFSANGDAPAPSSAIKTAFASTQLLDYPEDGIYSAKLSCTTSARGNETIVILGHAISTVRVDERCDCKELDWSFVNAYWIGQQGETWRSTQHVDRKGTVIDMKVFRQPG